MMGANDQKRTAEDEKALLEILKTRFEKNTHRHPTLSWEIVADRLERNPHKLYSIMEMERTGGEPDVVAVAGNHDTLYFFDCSPETPKDRRSLCYDKAALESRKEHKPKNSACGLAADMGCELLTEPEYLQLQELGSFDTKTSSWIDTPERIRKLGGAIFGDFRFGRVFIYHNGAESYYAGRGFRCKLTI